MFRHAKYLVLLGAAFSAACSSSPPRAYAGRVESREQLIGGQRALAEVGDFKISNGIIHAIIQDVGHSRGFGAFGGSLIDVDLVRGGKASAAAGVQGKDGFTEMFPAFLLEAIEPSKVEVAADGSEGPAIVRVSGRGGNFISMTRGINELALPGGELAYAVDYILEPGKQYIKIVVTVTNIDATKEAGFPLAIPFGFVVLMGEGQRLFVPGKAGYDMRFRLEEVYDGPAGIEAIPGEVASMIATEGDGVSYALAASPRNATYMANARAKDPQYYPDAKPDSMLLPMAFSSFLGTFWGMPPKAILPGKSYSYAGYLAVGSGDAASAQKVIYGIRDEQEINGKAFNGRMPTPVGTMLGYVHERVTRTPVPGVFVVLQDAQGNYVSSAATHRDGSYTAQVPPGRYRAFALDPTRPLEASTEELGSYVEITEGGAGRIDLEVDRTSKLAVTVLDGSGQRVPAKISVEAVYDHQGAEPPRKFLYNLSAGERALPSDLEPDADDPATRRYLEKVFFVPSGFGGASLRAGTYRVYASRGPEYDLPSAEVVLKPGQESSLTLTVNHVMPTPGYVSGDFHVHSVNSVDSPMKPFDRVASFAAEGVDFFASTDHNFVSDFAPTVEGMQLQRWLKTTVGIELTSLEMGHFNAFPLVLQPGPVTHGAFNWFRRPPGELFAQLRGLGKYPGKTVIQVNHPRDSIMGYFTQFNMGSYSGEPLPPPNAFSLDREPLPDGSPSPYAPENFNLDVDALEVFNGKHLEQVFHYRVPADPGSGEEPTLPPCTVGGPAECIPAVGELLERPYEIPDPANPGQLKTVLNPVYPGSLEDYYSLVSKGRRLTALGNSDSHRLSQEAGLPRSYIYVGDSADGSMEGLSELAVAEGIRAQKVIVTNGPFVELFVNELPVGSEVVAPDGRVTVRIKVQAAPWVDVSRVVLKRGGKDLAKFPEVLREYTVAPSTEVVRFEHSEELSGLPDDSFLVVEVTGQKSMWPVFLPLEIPSIELAEIIGNLGKTFGYEDKYGKYRPREIKQIKPFAFTNPTRVVWTKKQGLELRQSVLPLGPIRPYQSKKIPDLRRLLGQFHGD